MPRRKLTDIFRRDIRAKEAANATASNRPILSQSNDDSEDPISQPLPDIENLGLRVVHDLIKESVLLDIVFVHGLTGDSSSTWLHPSSERTHGREVHWPRDLVKCDVSNARISMFGYDANVASFWGGASQNRLSNHAENLLGELTGLREETGTENRYVIFVAHSLGGLVVKKALQLSESSAEKHLRRLQENTAGILFLGTPHSGSDFAPFAKSVGACLRLIGKRVNTDILDTLRRDSQVLLDVEDWFGQWLRRCAEASKSLQITCFYEELALPLIGKVVEEHQAKLTGYSAYGIHANHMDMAKFEGAEDRGYRAVRREVRRWIKILGDHQNEAKENTITATHLPAHESTPDLSHQRQLFLDHLFTCPYEDRKNINPERMSGTCEWFTTHQLFRSWNENDQSALLWVSADPGSGKSVLARYLIDHVLPIPGITVCYFFFKDGFSDQQSVLHALRSLIHQICLQNMSLISSFILQTSKMSETSFFNSFDRLWNTLIGFARQRATGEIICVLDGLDECREEDLLQLSAKLRSFFLEPTGDETRLKFLLTSRPYDYVRWELQELENLIPTIHLAGESEAEVEKISREIDIVVENRLRTIGIKRRLRDKERHHLLKLVMAVHNRTYLWICLTIDVIEKMHGFTRGNVIESLTTLPQTVDEAYENILRRCTDQKGAWKALHLILAATRPLSVSELSMAMILDDSDNSLSSIHKKAEPEERFAETLRNLCGLLVVIVQDKVYFLHQTAREFLVHPERKALSVSEDPSTLGPWKHSIQQVVGHSISARACIWYLVSDLWEGELEDFDPSTYQAYASQHWHYHLRKSDISSDDDIVLAALQLCRTHRFLVGMEGENPLSVAAYLGIQQVVQLLIKTSGPNADNQNDDCRTPLSWAAQEGNIELVEFLISQESTVLDGRDPCSPDLTPLHHAAVQGHAEVLQRLLDTKKVDVNAWLQYKTPCRDLRFDEFKMLRDFWSDTALCWAVRFGKSDVVRILLSDDNIDVESVNEYGETALMRAATQGDEKLVNIIAMSGKVNVNATDCRGLTVIERAAWRGQANVVRILLQTEKIDSESQNEALFTAVAHGKLSIVETFYSYTVFHSYGSIDANIVDENGETVLMRAASQGDLTIVEILLRFPGIDINSIGQGTGDDWGPGRRGDTALINAARAGHERVVQYLIDAGADTRMRNVDGDNALSTAAGYLHFGVLATVLGSADWPDGETRRLLCRARLRLVHQPEEHDALESAGLSEADRIRAEGVIELLHRHSSGNQS